MIVFALGYFFSFAANALYGPLAPSALMAVGLGAGAIGQATALQSLTRALFLPVWGRAADASGRGQALSALSFACGSVALTALAFVRSEAAVTAGFVLLGVLGSAGIVLLDGTMIGAVKGERTHFARGRVMGTVGYGVAAMVVMALRDAEIIGRDPRTVFLPAALLFALAAAIVAGKPVAVAPHPPQPTERVGSAAFFLLVTIGGLHWASHAAYTIFVAPLAEARGIRPLAVGVAILAGIAIEAIVLRSAHRFPGTPRRLLAAVAVVATVRWLLYPFADSVVAFVALSMLHGISFGLFFPTLTIEAARIAGSAARHRAQTVLTSLVFGLGGAAGTWIAGTVLERYGPRACWWSMAALSLAACAFSLLKSDNDSGNQGTSARPEGSGDHRDR